MRKLLISALLVFVLMPASYAQPTAPSVPVFAPRQSGSPSEPASPPQVKLPTLSQSMSELLGKLFQGSSRAGVIVKVADNKVYVDLGAADGAKAGDELEVVRKVTEVKHPVTGEKLGEERDVAGKLKVVSVQPRLSVCDLLSGQAEQKNDQGTFNKVLSAQNQSKAKVRLAKMAVDASAGLSETALSEALAAACAGSARLEVVDAAQAEYELRGQAKKSDMGVQLALALVELKSGRTVAQSDGVHRTVLTAADLGFKMAVVADIKTNLQLDPIYEAAKTVTRVKRADNALIFDAVGPSRHMAVVYADGKMVIAQRRSFSRLKDYDELEASFSQVCDFLRKGQATLPADLAAQTWHFNTRLYTDSGNVFREIWLQLNKYGETFDYVMAVPKTDIQEARLVIKDTTGEGLSWPDVSVDDKEVSSRQGRQGNFSETRDITNACRYGDHTFRGQAPNCGLSGCSRCLILQVRTAASADVWPSFHDLGNKTQGTVSPICGSVNELILPAELAQ